MDLGLIKLESTSINLPDPMRLWPNFKRTVAEKAFYMCKSPVSIDKIFFFCNSSCILSENSKSGKYRTWMFGCMLLFWGGGGCGWRGVKKQFP